MAKSMDDRVGVLVAIETLRALKSTPHDSILFSLPRMKWVYAAAATSAHGIDPDIGIAVDVTPSGDTPNAMKMEMALGNGPCIKIQDVSLIADAANWVMDDSHR